MRLVYIPAGEFLMGSADSDGEAFSNEKPQHRVYLDAYWIDRTEVTQGMYARCVAAGKCMQPDCSHGGDNYPVVCMGWDDAAAYCAWAGRRLPTEAEWEKAARGMDGRKYPWGNRAPDSGLLNFNRNVGNTTEVGHYPGGASPYGVLDLAGNVTEWVADWYAANYYASSPSRHPSGPSSGKYRVLRGGSWAYDLLSIRLAIRYGFPPDRQNDCGGFRCAR
jgi:formylglycine-generating enzyme required for sulfatase activity